MAILIGAHECISGLRTSSYAHERSSGLGTSSYNLQKGRINQKLEHRSL